MIRKLFSLLPPGLRLMCHALYRRVQDIRHGWSRQLTPRHAARLSLPVQRSVIQRVAPGATLEAKLHNMRKAIALLNGLALEPGRILSFWHIVGRPGRKQGYLPGRNIIRGQLVTDYGGGLCQLSSAMYELALRCGLEVPERHAHSTNVYTPETAYTTLGLDATLAYVYKDLRIRNPYPVPCHFRFELTESQLVAHICASVALPDLPLQVAHRSDENGLYATVYRLEQGRQVQVSLDFYRTWNG